MNTAGQASSPGPKWRGASMCKVDKERERNFHKRMPGQNGNSILSSDGRCLKRWKVS